MRERGTHDDGGLMLKLADNAFGSSSPRSYAPDICGDVSSSAMLGFRAT